MLPSKVRISHPEKNLGQVEVDQSLCGDICHLLKTSSKFNNIVHLTGTPGCGKTQHLYNIYFTVQESGFCQKNELLFLDCQPGCTPKSLLRCLTENTQQHLSHIGNIEVFIENLIRNNYKYLRPSVKAAVFNILLHFRVIFIDDVGSKSTLSIWKYLVSLIEEFSQKEDFPSYYLSIISTGCFDQTATTLQERSEQSSFQFKSIVLHRTEKERKLLYHDIQEITVGAPLKECKSLCERLKSLGNPKASKILSFLESNLTEEQHKEIITHIQTYAGDQNINCIYEVTLDFLTTCIFTRRQRWLLFQLSQMREPIPQSRKIAEEISFLHEVGLITESADEDGNVHIFLTPSTCQLVQKFQMESKGHEQFPDLNPLQLWMGLLDEELKSLFESAKEQRWAFLPEKWQYAQNVSKKDRYNVKDIIMSTCKYSKRFKEIDILEEMLYHAVKEEKYFDATGIMFVMDRFVYNRGTTKEFMDLLKAIQKKSPETPISPQIIIRKARYLKNEGDLQGAERILRRLDDGDETLCHWSYKSTADLQVQRSVCIQIRGDIRRALGFWADACQLLYKTIQLFKEVQPVPDKKGWASSLTLVSNTLRYIPLNDYQALKNVSMSQFDHPLREAIRCINEASDLCIYAPQFYAKNKRIAGEMNYFYAKLCSDTKEKRKFLLQAAHELREGLVCHKSINGLKSREEYYDFVCSVFRFATVCLDDVQDLEWKTKGEKILPVALHLYQHYCKSPKEVNHTKLSVALIQAALRFLRLPEISYQDTLQLNEHGVPDVQVKAPALVPFNMQEQQALSDSIRSAETILSTIETTIGSRNDAKDALNTWEANNYDDNMRECSTVEDSNTKTENLRYATTVLTLETEGTEESVGVVLDSDLYESSLLPSDCDFVNKDKKTENEDLLDHGDNQDSSRVGNSTLEKDMMKLRLEDTLETVEARPDDDIMDKVVQTLRKTTADVHRAATAFYDPVAKRWIPSDTVVYIGDHYMSGNCRRAYHFEHLTQDEVLGKYLGKQYIRDKGTSSQKQYEQDVIMQMVAREYASHFNKRLFVRGKLDYGQINFLPTLLVKITDVEESPSSYYNVEPFVSGNFVKISNNASDVCIETPGSQLMLAYSHFTYCHSMGRHLVVDIQGFTTDERKGQIYLTDPQIHSIDKRGFGTGNLGKRGMQEFWDHVHGECNDICRALGLTRP